ncbi:MAG: hypothetical protein Q8R57_00110, partial [Bacteroidota bacterium]|nr:hypothetical protein [Bacteroidota bacterium]
MKSKFTLICLFLAIISSYRAEAQTTVQMGTGTLSPTNTLYSPVYRFSATSTTSAVRSDIMFTAAEMAAAGIPVGATITKVEFNKTNANNFVTPANFKMYMGNTSSTALATTLTWASILTTHSLVFTNTALNLPATTGWVSWNLNSPFTYTGGTFELATEMTMVGNGGATGNILWEYTSTVPTTYIVGAFGTALPATLNGAVADYKRRPNIRITYINARTPNNAGIEKLIEPINFCGGNQDIKVKLKNFGSNQISFVNINWELDGIPMPIIYWSSLLDTTGGFGVSDTVITLDTAVSFASGLAKSLKVWTSLPNGLVDSTTSDDTLYAMLKPSLAAGVYTVGPSGNFASLTEVSNELKFGVCGSVIFEIQSSYNSSVETLPITFKEISGANSTTGVIIRPESIASSINISGSHANTIIDLDRTKFLTIDGRAGGNGASVLTIENTSTSGAAIRFINSAQFDTLQYVTFKASNTLASSGVVFFSN